MTAKPTTTTNVHTYWGGRLTDANATVDAAQELLKVGLLVRRQLLNTCKAGA